MKKGSDSLSYNKYMVFCEKNIKSCQTINWLINLELNNVYWSK